MFAVQTQIMLMRLTVYDYEQAFWENFSTSMFNVMPWTHELELFFDFEF